MLMLGPRLTLGSHLATLECDSISFIFCLKPYILTHWSATRCDTMGGSSRRVADGWGLCNVTPPLGSPTPRQPPISNTPTKNANQPTKNVPTAHL